MVIIMSIRRLSLLTDLFLCFLLVSTLGLSITACAQYGADSVDNRPSVTEMDPPECETCGECEICSVCETCGECEKCDYTPTCPDDDSSWTVVCHVPPGSALNEHTILIGASAVNAHMDHGDYLGACTEQ